MKISAVFSSALLVSSLSLNVQSDEIAHNQVTVIDENMTSAHSTWQPRLYVRRGCQPYAAVDAQGNYSGGLSARGSESGSCSTQGRGQTYVRSACWQVSGRQICANMYAWYFPKDMFMTGNLPIAGAGHRHDWEDVIIWTDNNSFAGAAYSQHGDYDIRSRDDSANSISGNTLTVQYDRNSGTHSLEPTSQTTGVMPAGISYFNLPSVARRTLANRDWGSANFPMKDSNFLNNIREAIPVNLTNDYGFTAENVR